MYKHLLAACLLALPLALGCSGATPPPTSVTEDERQAQIDEQKQVDLEEAAHRKSGG